MEVVTVDAAPPAGSLCVSISDLARRKGVSKQAIAKRVDRFEAEGLLTTTQNSRGHRLVPLALYDRLTGDTADLGRSRPSARAPEMPGGAEDAPLFVDRAPAAPAVDSPTGTYTAAQARDKQYQADLREIQLAEKKGEILLVVDVAQAMADAAEIIVRRIQQIPALADEIAAAVAKGGADGARRELKAISNSICQSVADALSDAMAKDNETRASAPEDEEEVEE